jgi:hypothetical protein
MSLYDEFTDRRFLAAVAMMLGIPAIGVAVALWAVPTGDRYTGLEREFTDICTVVKWARKHRPPEVIADAEAVKGCYKYGRDPR